MILFNNGLVIQERTDSRQFGVRPIPAEFRQSPEMQLYLSYQGLARYLSWPFEYKEDSLSKELTAEADQRWFDSWEALEIVPDLEYCRRYLRACRDRGITTRTLFCRTESERPIWQGEIPESVFIGYDYATYVYFYSLIPDDLLADAPIPLLEESRAALNENKLFSNEADILRYIEKREAAIKGGAPLQPDGNYCIYHLSEVKEESLLRGHLPP